jgi:hypothetical protein
MRLTHKSWKNTTDRFIAMCLDMNTRKKVVAQGNPWNVRDSVKELEDLLPREISGAVLVKAYHETQPPTSSGSAGMNGLIRYANSWSVHGSIRYPSPIIRASLPDMQRD